jgi:hypothetical protein
VMGLFQFGLPPVSLPSIEPSSCDEWLELVHSYPLNSSRLDFTTAMSFPHALTPTPFSQYAIKGANLGFP